MNRAIVLVDPVASTLGFTVEETADLLRQRMRNDKLDIPSANLALRRVLVRLVKNTEKRTSGAQKV
jgi:hypothetical protein